MLNCKYLHTTPGRFREMILDLLEHYRPEGIPVRMVFFGNPAGNLEYNEQFTEIREIISNWFGEDKPSVSYVAQPPCAGGMILEVHETNLLEGERVYYKQRNNIDYLTVEGQNSKRLYLSGITGDFIKDSLSGQSEKVFRLIDEILFSEQMPVSSITRQWNYIEKITSLKEGKQNYQEFNDARSLYYDQADWSNGYPAATGIGTLYGGIMIDLNAETGKEWQIASIDNPLQVPAHVYSEKVLVNEEGKGTKKKTTPKFERAKAVGTDQGKVIYVSGTAAIRGENSLEEMDIIEQTRITLENIEQLISVENAMRHEVFLPADATPVNFRVYLKDKENYSVVKGIIDKRYPGLPVGYVVADVCRLELLIEIEGMASVDN